MSCNHKVKNTCGERLFATCVYYEQMVPAISELAQEDCYTVEEIIADIYGILEKQEVDLTALGQACITYPLTDGEIKLADAILKLEEEICTLKQNIATRESYNICEMPLADCNLDLGTLVDQCANPITTLGQLLQVLVDQHQA